MEKGYLIALFLFVLVPSASLAHVNKVTEISTSQAVDPSINDFVKFYELSYNEVSGENGIKENQSVPRTCSLLKEFGFTIKVDDWRGMAYCNATRNCVVGDDGMVTKFLPGTSYFLNLCGAFLQARLHVYNSNEYARLRNEAIALWPDHKIVRKSSDLYTLFVTSDGKVSLKFYTFTDRSAKEGKYLIVFEQNY